MKNNFDMRMIAKWIRSTDVSLSLQHALELMSVTFFLCLALFVGTIIFLTLPFLLVIDNFYFVDRENFEMKRNHTNIWKWMIRGILSNMSKLISFFHDVFILFKNGQSTFFSTWFLFLLELNKLNIFPRSGHYKFFFHFSTLEVFTQKWFARCTWYIYIMIGTRV